MRTGLLSAQASENRTAATGNSQLMSKSKCKSQCKCKCKCERERERERATRKDRAKPVQ